MAMLKSTIKEQVSAAIAQQNPGDRALVTFETVTGPSPWLMSMLGFVGRMMVKYYFVTVTDQAIVVHRVHRVNNRPQEVTHVIPRDQAQNAFSDVNLSTLWSSVRLALPGEAAPVRLNVHRAWRTELEQLLATVGGAPQQQFAGQQPGMPPAQQPGMPQAPQQGYAPQGMPQQQPQAAPQPGYPQQPQPGYQGAPAPAPGQPQQPGYQQAPQQPVAPQQNQYGYPPAQPQQAQPGYPQQPQPGYQQAPQQPPYGAPQQGNPYGG
ncbi:hypothetical protein [Streptomyces natalensis]|uniref:Uncharacterized protein n=1 Tax=Streptomyces natalensis ATCC 27448 TaxID=1240678 RepID=A0A0D7CCW9_9ACTN|nr:hypothetical protein [Streptomyces natalensis]KIZ13735.1 hypothetical protein SNA_37690 [Streptomyces natalensis ATCC 27448]